MIDVGQLSCIAKFGSRVRLEERVIAVVRSICDFVNRHDPRVFESPRSAGFLQKPCLNAGVKIAAFGTQVLQGNIASEDFVVCEPDAADSTGGVQPGQIVPLVDRV